MLPESSKASAPPSCQPPCMRPSRMLTSTYLAISTGEMSVVSHTVEALIGHALQTLADYVH